MQAVSEAPDLSIPERMNAAEVFVDRNVAEGRGEKVAIYSGEQQVTYGDLLANTNRAGNALRALGLQIENRVLLLLLDGPDFAYCFFGCMKIGAVPIPVNTPMRSEDYEYVLSDSRARVAVVSDTLLPQVQAIPPDRLLYLRHIVVSGRQPSSPEGNAEAAYQGLESLMASSSSELEAVQLSSDDAAFWLYSSGSTGFPKGCVHLQHDMLFCAEYYARGVLRISEADRTFSVAKLFFAYGLGNALYFPFYVGASTVLFPGRPEPARVFEHVEQFRPTLFFSVPTTYAALLAAPGDYDFSSVRQAVSAGEALPKAIFERFWERFGVEILDGIGSTEVLHIFISNRPGMVRAGSSGTAVPGYEAKLLDEAGHPTPVGEIGNLLVKGDSTCAFYWNRHHQTVQTILGEWIKTGDKYHQDEDGYYWYAGRTDDMLKVGGIWVSPIEIENTLLGHPAVLEAGVVGRSDQDELVKPLAYVVLKQDNQASEKLTAELREFVRDGIAPFQVPALDRVCTGATEDSHRQDSTFQTPRAQHNHLEWSVTHELRGPTEHVESRVTDHSRNIRRYQPRDLVPVRK